MRPDARSVRLAVLRWAPTVDRPLPWRGERDPYKVLVSEVMLQQTQAARVVEPYERFLKRFPSARLLARAELADVLRAWGNLGYPRRAVALWRGAHSITELGFPTTVEAIGELPGVGDYTARAVASFAFDVNVAAVDANVRRVVSRLHGLPPDADVQAIADALVPKEGAADWNQAMIDLGALVCRSRSPTCAECPLKRMCAWSNGYRPSARPRPAAPPFASTARYVRGRIVARLRAADAPVRIEGLRREVDVEHPRFDEALRSLEADDIVTTRGGRVALGVTERASGARPRRGRGNASRRA